MTTATIQDVTDATFAERVGASRGAVLVDFMADWCPPCRVLEPILEEIAREHADTLTVFRLNADENTQIPIQFNVMGFPTMILFRDGQPVKQIMGARPKQRLLRELAPFLGQ